MKKLNITKEHYNKSRYFKNKYGRLTHVNESKNVYRTSKGKLIRFVSEAKIRKNIRLNTDEVMAIDSIVFKSKVDWFELRYNYCGTYYVWDKENDVKMSLKDGLDEFCQGVCNGDWVELFGLQGW